MPEFAPHLYDVAVEVVLIAQAAIVVEGEPAAHLGQFGCRKVVERAAHRQFDQENAGWMKDIAQQTPLERQLLTFVDIAKHAQSIDGAIEFGSSRAAEWVRANLLAPLLKGLDSQGGGRALLFHCFPFTLLRLLVLSVLLKLLQAFQFAALPELVALVFAQARSADAPQMPRIAGPPQVQYGVIANDERTRDGQQFGGDALERLLKWFPGR